MVGYIMMTMNPNEPYGSVTTVITKYMNQSISWYRKLQC